MDESERNLGKLIEATVPFNDPVEAHETRWESEKVRRNSADDYDLVKQGYVYCGGCTDTHPKGKPEWRVLYVKLRPSWVTALRNRMCDRMIGSFALVRSPDGSTVRWVCEDKRMIARVVGGPVTDVPAELEGFIR